MASNDISDEIPPSKRISQRSSELFRSQGYRPTLRRLASETFAAVGQGNSSLIPIEPREKHLWKYLLIAILVVILSFIALYYGYQLDINSTPKVYNNTVYAFLFLILCNLFIILDYTDKFPRFQVKFEYYGLYFLIAFLLIAFIDYLLIGLNEDALIEGIVVIVVIEILFWIAIICFFCTFLAYWKSFSFHCSGKSWIHALLYLSVIGAIVIFICRWLHPPPTNKTDDNPDATNSNITYWHKKHNTQAILSAVISILTLLFLFCVILGGIGICLFSEFATYTSQFGIEIAFISFVAISFLIMLTPLAPGSIIDACGGFIFIILLVPDRMGFFSAWGIAVVTVVILHFCGACIQWWMGTWRSIQVWGNTNLPVEMLAASDAVLRDANWFTVGLVGYIFLDTANGLNQGRINMPFWTQLFSEWPAIPNALGLVSFGATIAAPAIGLEGYDWTMDAVPLLIIFSTVVQAVGFTFGTRAMAGSVDKKKYWNAREKWEMVHYFKKSHGFIPTMEGWKNDVYNLGNDFNNICDEFKSILFNKVEPVHNKYVADRDKLKDAQERLNLYRGYLMDLCKIRQVHYEEFIKHIDKAIEKKWLIYEEPKDKKLGYFDVEYEEDEIVISDDEPVPDDARVAGYGDHDERKLPPFKQYLQWILVTVLVITFWASFYGFYWTSDLAATVQGGISSLRSIAWYYYVTLCLFIGILIFINHVELLQGAKSFCSGLYFVFTGCKVDPNIETRFETPEWKDAIPDDIAMILDDKDIELEETKKFEE